MASSPYKPAWLEAFHVYLRERPIRRAAFWAFACFVLFAVYLRLADGRALTVRNLAIEFASWSVAGVVFYALMRWWDANHAR